MDYEIREASFDDIDKCMELASFACKLMVSRNNPQWLNGYPTAEILEDDVLNHQLYVAFDKDELVAMAAIQEKKDEIYEEYDFWTKGPYISVHRVASRRSGLGRYFLNMAIDKAKKIGANVRIDTHIKNLHMQALIESLGFVAVGETDYGYIDNTLAKTYELVLINQ